MAAAGSVAGDLPLRWPLPFSVRRTSLSQHPALGSFGVGWKPNHTPFLILSDDERRITAADANGAVLLTSVGATKGD